MLHVGASLIAQLVKKPPAMQETRVRFLGREDPLEKGKTTHSSFLAWRIPLTVHGFANSQTGLSDFHFQCKLFYVEQCPSKQFLKSLHLGPESGLFGIRVSK